jgi:inorganic pyrophosphatase
MLLAVCALLLSASTVAAKALPLSAKGFAVDKSAHHHHYAHATRGPAPLVSADTAGFIIVVVAAVGFVFAMYWWYVVAEIVINPRKDKYRTNEHLTHEVMADIYQISQRVSDGATTFLFAEYKYMLIFMTAFGSILFVLLGGSLSSPVGTSKPVQAPWVNAFLSVLSFGLGSLSSVLSGWIGMRIAVFCNSRTAIMATEGADEGDAAQGFAAAFETAFRGGITMGFALTSMAMFSLFATVKLNEAYFGTSSRMAPQLYECVAAFGLGASTIACFGRIGGGIDTKAADVGSDLAGKLEKNIPEDDARNPGVIADCIGDNVGDIAGMGSDLFGSFAEASCAAFVIASESPELSGHLTYMMYPLLLSAAGVVVCMATSLLAASNCGVTCAEEVEPALKRQLLLSTVLATAAAIGVTALCLPPTFTLGHVDTSRWHALICVLAGLWCGLFIGYATEYYTSNAYEPVKEVSAACETGAATNIIYGLALGYMSVVPPTVAMAVTIYTSYRMAGLYGYALAALGILSTMSIGLTIDAYGPIADNAGGFAEMAHMGPEIRDVTDALDAAGNTTAAIGKGFAIASAAFVALALYGAFVTRVQLPLVNVLDQRVMAGLFVGAMLPYWFSAMTMKSVGLAAMDMVNEIRRQFQDPRIVDGTVEPDYNACVQIATQAALRQMIAPATLVITAPIVTGILFGKFALAGLLPGALVSGVQMAISSSNTGGAWDNAKKFIEAGGLGKGKGKGSPQHAAAVTGDTVGDPLKDTSGPALNILIKLMAIISVVFAPVVQSKFGGVIMNYLEGTTN